MKIKTPIQITEVGPRDGLQNEKEKLTVEDRVAFVRSLVETGVEEIEVGAFVSPKWVPQMADTKKVVEAVMSLPDKTIFSALVPNERGMQEALASGIKKVSVFTAASESFNQKNINCSIKESFERFQSVVKLAEDNVVSVRGYISTAFVCPYEGNIQPEQVLNVAKSFLDLGVTDLSIGDTIGKASPDHVARLFEILLPFAQDHNLHLAMHFHDTYNLALVNVHESLKWGVTHFDSSAGGLGGCPYAPGAAGNLATEDLVFYLQSLALGEKYDLKKIVNSSQKVFEKINKMSPSKVHQVVSQK